MSNKAYPQRIQATTSSSAICLFHTIRVSGQFRNFGSFSHGQGRRRNTHVPGDPTVLFVLNFEVITICTADA